MELAFGLKHTSNDYLAKVTTARGCEFRKVSTLVRGGLPKESRSHVSYRGNLSEFRLTDASEYLRAFDLDIPPQETIRHQFFECRSFDVRVQVPALALLRAIFRPTEYFLPRLFYPNALERVRYINFHRSPPTAIPLIRRWTETARYGDLIGPLEWLSFYPSAKHFASSVYIHALDGWIGCDLPEATVQLSMRGARTEKIFFAATITVTSLTSGERPFSFAGEREPVSFRRATFAMPYAAPERCDPRIAPHDDGTVDLTDEEWREIEPLLETGRGRHGRRAHDRRLLMDGLLRKLGLGTGWKSTAYRTGGATNALHAFREWTRSGAMDQALEVISRFRQ